jgi:hypothetical protein
MASQVEDHVDWSDGTLGSPDHILSIVAAGQGRELSPVVSIDYATKANERADLLESPSLLPLRLRKWFFFQCYFHEYYIMMSILTDRRSHYRYRRSSQGATARASS